MSVTTTAPAKPLVTGGPARARRSSGPAVVLTALSLVPDVLADASAATKILLVLTPWSPLRS